MTQAPLDARTAALKRFGYTDREASFLHRVALLSGYFLRRQYCTYIEKQIGGTAAALVEKALAKKHAVVAPGFYGTKVYHLRSRPFYAALGQENNRNRREREAEAIKQRLMILDFIQTRTGDRVLATEQDKVNYFTRERGVEISALPTKDFGTPKSISVQHRFADRYPILVPSGRERVAQLSFCFIDEGLAGVSRFESYLREYSALFAALGSFRIEYVAAAERNFVAAQQALNQLLSQLQTGNGAGTANPQAELFTYFKNRMLFEEAGVTAFDRAKLLQFRDQREAFFGSETDEQFAHWKANRGTSSVTKPQPKTNIDAHFSTVLLKENYELFGSLSRV